MKRVLILTAILAVAGARVAMGAMANSDHDLTSTSGATIHSTDGTEICKFCHIPHNGSPADRRPLWNHALTSSTLTWNATNKTVRGTSLPTDTTAAALAGSRACLSCHDGTVALGDVLSTPDFTFTDGGDVIAGKLAAGDHWLNPAAFGSNHPVGVVKPADKAGFTPFKASPTNDAVDYDSGGYVQCQSCHNPHLTTNAPFLRKANTNSAICTTCHDL